MSTARAAGSSVSARPDALVANPATTARHHRRRQVGPASMRISTEELGGQVIGQERDDRDDRSRLHLLSANPSLRQSFILRECFTGRTSAPSSTKVNRRQILNRLAEFVFPVAAN